MPLATFHAQHLLFASLGGELWERRARAVLGDDAALLSHEGPLPSGSNAWAVGGARTASGRPLIGGDPHRIIESPGVYLQIRLACDEFDVAGFTFAGVPGVQHFAHAGDVAWAITNAMADYQDVHDAGPVIEQWTETIAVRDGEPDEVEVEVTEHGPVFTDGLSFRGTSTVLGDLGFNALLPLLRSRTVDDVDRALDAWVEPVNNAVIADRHGSVRYRLAGRIPLRQSGGDGDEWTGWHGPNRAEIPADGQVVTANERRGPESDLVGADFAPAYRADRIHALLDGRDASPPPTSEPSTTTPTSRRWRCCADWCRGSSTTGTAGWTRTLPTRRGSRPGATRWYAGSRPSRSSRRCTSRSPTCSTRRGST